MSTSAPAWLKNVVVNEMPNFTGVIASPRLTCRLAALNAATSAQRASNDAGRLQLGPDARDALRSPHRLAVVRRVALAVEVARADDVRRQIERPRDAIEDLLDHEHALRAAEAAEGGVRDVVRAADAADHVHVRHEVAVVEVEHRAAEHRRAQVERTSRRR